MPLAPQPPTDVAWTLRTTAALQSQGYTQRQIARAVRDGHLIRVRRGHFVLPGLPAPVLSAAELGTRLDCLSLLAARGVFVLHTQPLHVQVDPLASRRPHPVGAVRRHWRPTDASDDALMVPVVEALVQSVRCQPPRAAVATLDSAWHLGLVDAEGVAEVFARLPAKYAALRPLLDRRAEAGTESIARLMLRGLGCDVRLQVQIDGVGRVDLLVDGWLIVECDSEQFHSGWREHKNDRRRDLAALALGYTTVRLLAEDLLFHPDRVLRALRATVDRGATVRNS
jgi:very-short-patch-repair endonuclease